MGLYNNIKNNKEASWIRKIFTIILVANEIMEESIIKSRKDNFKLLYPDLYYKYRKEEEDSKLEQVENLNEFSRKNNFTTIYKLEYDGHEINVVRDI